jgi:acetyl-CoA synthetase
MSDVSYPVPSDFADKANLSAKDYQENYARSLKDPSDFWGEQAKRLTWMKAPKQIKDVSWRKATSMCAGMQTAY